MFCIWIRYIQPDHIHTGQLLCQRWSGIWRSIRYVRQIGEATVSVYVLTAGLNLYVCLGHDWVGVWRTPPTANPYGLQVWSDFLMTSILVVAGMGLLATPGQWASLWMGQARPIPGKYVSGPNAHPILKGSLGAWWPKGAKHFLERTVLLVLQFSTVYYGVMMLIFFGMCQSYNIFAGPGASVGAEPGRGHDPQCWINPVIYIWVRAAVFTVEGMFVYPIAYVQALDVENVPAWALRRWKATQDKARGGNPGKAVATTQPNSADL